MFFIPGLLFRSDEVSTIRAELAGYADVRPCERADELLQTVAQEFPAAVLVAVRDPEGGSTASVVRRVRRSFPAVPVVAHCALMHQDVAGLAAVFEAGACTVALHGSGTAQATLNQILIQTDRERLAAAVLRELKPVTSAALTWLVRYCFAHCREELTVDRIAQACGIPRRTLSYQLRRDGLPSAERLIIWSRLLMTAYLLESATRSVEQIAYELGFSSGAVLRTNLKNYTGLRPNDVREGGGLVFLAHHFRIWLLRCQARPHDALAALSPHLPPGPALSVAAAPP